MCHFPHAGGNDVLCTAEDMALIYIFVFCVMYTLCHVGGNDVLSTAEDMALTGSRLRQGGSLRETVYLKDYSHMDFIWDTNAPKTAYPAVLAALSR